MTLQALLQLALMLLILLSPLGFLVAVAVWNGPDKHQED